MPSLGTRSSQNTRQETFSTRSANASRTLDLGMSKNVIALLTFGGNQVSGANGTFAAFVVGDVLLVEGVNLNNGNFEVAGIDGTNHAFLTLNPPPKPEGPIIATVRTI